MILVHTKIIEAPVQSMNIIFTATSYPRNISDWQSVFIKKLLDAYANHPEHSTYVWAPEGPLHRNLNYLCTPGDIKFLNAVAEKGGISHLLRNNKPVAALSGVNLLWRMRRVLWENRNSADIYHLNWLQSLIPFWNIPKPAVATILGSDFQLLKVPGMVSLVRQVLKKSPVILAPNNEWMIAPLEDKFGDLAEIHYVPFGIDKSWFDVNYVPVNNKTCWICVLRITKQKMGRLFEWGEPIFKGSSLQELHVFGPNQENLDIPSWVHYHGPATAEVLAREWFPRACGLISLSEHSEGRPQVMLEALAAGIPVIASRTQAHTDLLKESSAGLLVSTQEEFQWAITQYTDTTRREKSADAARRLARNAYGTWDDCYTRYMSLYTRLLI